MTTCLHIHLCRQLTGDSEGTLPLAVTCLENLIKRTGKGPPPLDIWYASHKKEVISIKNLDGGDCNWYASQILLGWVINKVNMMMYELRVTSPYSIYFDSGCCCSMTSINYSSGRSKNLLDWSNLAWSLVSRQPLKDEVSEVIVSHSFLMCPDENFLNSAGVQFSYGCSI